MDSLTPEHPPATNHPAGKPRAGNFWRTALWGFVVFGAMFLGQIGVVAVFVLKQGGLVDLATTIKAVAASGIAISLSVIGGVPAVLAALWLAVRGTRMSFADYLALRRFDWRAFLVGAVGLGLLVFGWDMVSRLTGREVTPDFMIDVIKSAEIDRTLWLLVIAFCVAAPISEELFARGLLYRGWSESPLGVLGAIILSSIVWTGLHLQYDWFFLCEVFCIGLWLGYLRYRFNSTWLTIIVHGLNNLGALAETLWLAAKT